MIGLLSFVFGLLLYWGLISLPATTRRDEILPGASDVMGSISHSLYFFLLRICGLVVSELPVMGSPWAWFCYFFIFSDFSSSFFWFFFFCLKVEQINFFFFNLIVFLIFD